MVLSIDSASRPSMSSDANSRLSASATNALNAVTKKDII